MSMREFLDSIPDHRTCRFCKGREIEDRLVKYGTRHYAHPKCFLEALGPDGFDRLSLCALRNFPKDEAQARGLLEILKDKIEAETPQRT